MNNKKIIFLIIVSLFINSFYAEAPGTTDTFTNENVTEQDKTWETEDYNKQAQLDRKLDLILQFEPLLYISPESMKYKSNLVNMNYSITFGALFPADYFISFQPTLKFFTMTHGLINNTVLPIEIENRTATTISLMLDLPALFNIFFTTSRLQFAIGPGIFARFGVLAAGISDNDYGESGSAINDVAIINKWFWNNAHWLYLSAGASWLYNITYRIKIGPSISFYIPITEIIQKPGFQDVIISFGLKLCS